ncbi:hypothetical protein [Anaerotruncus rubiinfantis]|uniref:hypothetical protein n=1 Tax=Anaerotruncus rubiinfantis TaxID=1720200 RepID=UPI001897917B|nr:hypothetical protein [Anaerotruncus rubiinfantis]
MCKGTISREIIANADTAVIVLAFFFIIGFPLRHKKLTTVIENLLKTVVIIFQFHCKFHSKSEALDEAHLDRMYSGYYRMDAWDSDRQTNKISEDQFKIWIAEASKARQVYKAGDISGEKMLKRLSGGKNEGKGFTEFG